MPELQIDNRTRRALLNGLAVVCFAVAFAHGQITYPNEEVEVHDLPWLTAISNQPFDVLRTSLQIVLHDRDICCGRNSALIDSLEAADPESLKDVASKLEGRHLLSDGRPIVVKTEYLTPEQAGAGHLVAMILFQHAALMEWDGRIYVLRGLTYVEDVGYDTYAAAYLTHKFLLEDVRYSDSRREITFDRLTEDAGKVQGLLFLDWKPQ